MIFSGAIFKGLALSRERPVPTLRDRRPFPALVEAPPGQVRNQLGQFRPDLVLKWSLLPLTPVPNVVLVSLNQ
ncbi:MAG: hypothetical protein QOH31_6834 [Verrucomicrobiota bacterium]